MNLDHDQTSQSSSFSQRMMSLSPISCFIINQTSDHHSSSLPSTFNDSDSDTCSTTTTNSTKSSTSSSSSTGWLKSGSPIKEKCANLISKLGGTRRHRRRSNRKVDFSYDPVSYALNFDDEATAIYEYEDERGRNFSDRLSLDAPQNRISDESMCVVASGISAAAAWS